MENGPTQTGIRVLTFRVAQIRCGMRAGGVREIVPMAATIKAPGQPSIVEGFLNLRGTMLPIVRLAGLFDLPFEPRPESHVIVMQTQASQIEDAQMKSAPPGLTPIGLLVDGVDDVVTIDPAQLRPIAANHALNDCAEAEFTAGGDSLVLLDCGRLFLAQERRRIRELQAQLERRRSVMEAAST